jgi:hypothetical protein
MDHRVVETNLKRHPLLSGNSRWSITGYFLDEQGRKPVEGNWLIETLEQGWQIQVQLKQLSPSRTVLERSCLLTPLTEPPGANRWSEQMSPYGSFQGQMNVVEDTLLLQLDSDDGKYRSVESFLRVFEREYEARGAIMEGNERLGSWTLELVRLEGGRQ